MHHISKIPKPGLPVKQLACVYPAKVGGGGEHAVAVVGEHVELAGFGGGVAREGGIERAGEEGDVGAY